MKNIVFAALTLLALTLQVCTIALTRSVQNTLTKLDGMLVEVAKTSGAFASSLTKLDVALENAGRISKAAEEYTVEQVAMLRKNQKSIEASLQLAASLKGTVNLMNTEIIPRTMHTLDSLDSTIASLESLSTNIDHEVNRHLLPAMSATIVEGGRTVEDFRRLVDDPSLPHILQNIEMFTQQTAEASRRMPSIAADVEEITETTRKWRRAILGVQIAAAIIAVAF